MLCHDYNNIKKHMVKVIYHILFAVRIYYLYFVQRDNNINKQNVALIQNGDQVVFSVRLKV